MVARITLTACNVGQAALMQHVMYQHASKECLSQCGMVVSLKLPGSCCWRLIGLCLAPVRATCNEDLLDFEL